MLTSGRRWPAVFAGLLIVVSGMRASAEEITLTGGTVGIFNGIDLPGFTLTGTNSSFTGILPEAGVICCVFHPGDVARLDRTFALSTLAGQPTAQLVNGTSYVAYVTGTLAFTTTPFTVPAGSSPTFTFSTPFVASGHISGFADLAHTIPLFNVDLNGSGTATVSGRTTSDPTFIGDHLSFPFAPATPAPTPEPASALLLCVGAGCVIAWKRLMT